MHDSFYHLHVCKTGGRWFSETLLYNNLYRELQSQKIPIINKKKDHDDIGYSHYGMHPAISENTYIVAGIREPVTQICSLFVDARKIHAHSYKAKERFLDEIFSPHTNTYINNQSKHFFYGQKIKDYGSHLKADGDNYEETCIKNAMRVNYFYIYQDNLDPKKIMQDMLVDLDLPDDKFKIWFSYIDEKNKYIGKNEASKDLYESLSEEEKNKILNKLASIDQKIYNIALSKHNSVN